MKTQGKITEERHEYNLDLGITTALLVAFIMQGINILRILFEGSHPKLFDISLFFYLLIVWLLCQAIVKAKYVEQSI